MRMKVTITDKNGRHRPFEFDAASAALAAQEVAADRRRRRWQIQCRRPGEGDVWRARQQCRIATAAMQRAAQIAEDTFPGQLRLRW